MFFFIENIDGDTTIRTYATKEEVLKELEDRIPKEGRKNYKFIGMSELMKHPDTNYWPYHLLIIEGCIRHPSFQQEVKVINEKWVIT